MRSWSVHTRLSRKLVEGSCGMPCWSIACGAILGVAPPDAADGHDYFHTFASYEDAAKFADEQQGAEHPVALVLQEEYIDEPKTGEYVHMLDQRVTEWPAEFLRRPRRTADTIPAFLASDAPPNRLDILRGHAP